VDQSNFPEASDLTQILSMVVECMGGAKQKDSISINDAQKYNSLRGRWCKSSNFCFVASGSKIFHVPFIVALCKYVQHLVNT
jgi:hypothetical protein